MCSYTCISEEDTNKYVTINDVTTKDWYSKICMIRMNEVARIQTLNETNK